MAKITEIIGKIKISVDTNISLWQAIKLRIAGKNYEPIVREISEQIKKRIECIYKES